jgi:hypothetical protein
MYTSLLLHPAVGLNALSLEMICGDVFQVKFDPRKHLVFAFAQVHKPKTGGLIW